LPLGGQSLVDHRYLIGLIAGAWGNSELGRTFSGPLDEIYWTLGVDIVRALMKGEAHASVSSKSFENGGFYVMRDHANHVFIDCGPVGLAGRGGHGHNDCLSFEATLDRVNLITDSGTLTYTGSYTQRNRFRSTLAHNTPIVDRREINRFYGVRMLWSIRDDARSEVLEWRTDARQDTFRGTHRGYSRLSDPVLVERSVILDHQLNVLAIEELISGNAQHVIEVPLHLAPGIEVEVTEKKALRLCHKERVFQLQWRSEAPWEVTTKLDKVSPSYGVCCESRTVLFRTRTMLPVRLRYCVGSEVPTAVWEQWFASCRS
jgi:hypothetical protein